MLHVDVACSGSNCTTDSETVASKEPGHASREVLQARVKLDFKLDGTCASVCTENRDECLFFVPGPLLIFILNKISGMQRSNLN